MHPLEIMQLPAGTYIYSRHGPQYSRGCCCSGSYESAALIVLQARARLGRKLEFLKSEMDSPLLQFL